jgi:Bacterial aa3 type cytochrome c oxidase subunit IV
MANTQTTETTSPDMDYKQHDATWKGFTALVKWGIIGLAVLVVLLFIAINP